MLYKNARIEGYFYKYTLRTIPLSIMHGNEILTLIDILLSQYYREVSKMVCVCVFNSYSKAFTEKDDNAFH